MVTKYDIAARAEIAGISGKRVKLTAGEQREIFGGYVFGKQDITVDTHNQGAVKASRSVIPRDCVFATWALDDVAEAVNEGRKLRVS